MIGAGVCKASVTKVSRPENDPKPIYKSRHEINDFAIFYGLSLFPLLSDGLVRKNCHVEKPFFTMKVHEAKQIKLSILATKLSMT